MKLAQGTIRHATPVAPTVAVILLAGGLRYSPLRQQLGMPSLCLPLLPNVTLLDRWLLAAESLPGCQSVVIAVSGNEDADSIRALADRRIASVARRVDVHVIVEPDTWRGPAGLLYDLLQSGRCGMRGDGRTVVVAGEASCLPLDDLRTVTECLTSSSPGVSVTSRTGAPTGIYAFTETALRLIPSLGFHDIKEQMLPALYARGTPVQAMRIPTDAIRVWDRESYLGAMRATLKANCSETGGCSPGARIAETARVVGHCLIESGAVVAPEAIVHESIVLAGAVIGRGAVVSHSVLGRSARIPQWSTVKHSVVGPVNKGWRSVPSRVLSERVGLGAMLRGERFS